MFFNTTYINPLNNPSFQRQEHCLTSRHSARNLSDGHGKEIGQYHTIWKSIYFLIVTDVFPCLHARVYELLQIPYPHPEIALSNSKVFINLDS